MSRRPLLVAFVMAIGASGCVPVTPPPLDASLATLELPAPPPLRAPTATESAAAAEARARFLYPYNLPQYADESVTWSAIQGQPHR